MEIQPPQPVSTETATAERQSRWRNLILVLVLAVIMGGVISLYVLSVSHLTARQKDRSPIEKAALLVAEELSSVSISHASFGRLGLCDQPASYKNQESERQPPTSSINTLYGTLRLNILIARKLGYETMLRAAEADVSAARLAEVELCRKLHQAVQPSPYTSDSPISGSLYERVYRMLAREKTADGGELIDLRIKLGTLKSGQGRTYTPVPQTLFVADSRWSADGFYTPNVDVPVVGLPALRFVAIGDNATAVSVNSFVISDFVHAPSVVLMEAVYKAARPQGRSVQYACVLAGSPPLKSEASVFMINFPNGVPPQTQSTADLLSEPMWSGVGVWQQAINAEVPGSGSLGPPRGIRADMKPHEAVQIALYHWLRQVGPQMSPLALIRLINEQWDSPSRKAAGYSTERLDAAETIGINSCLALDTGAREYTLLNQTAPSENGQTAILNAFSMALPDRVFPLSALPLCIDRQGNYNLPGHERFDKELVSRFLDTLHKTNLAGIETKAIAHSYKKRAEVAIAQLEQQLLLTNEELKAVRQKLSSVEGKIPTRSSLLLESRLKVLDESQKRQDAERRKYLAIRKLSQQAWLNGERGAVKSYEVGSRIFKLAAQGLYEVKLPARAYLLSKKLLFTPCLQPLSEKEILDAALSPEGPAKSRWLAMDFKVLSDITKEPQLSSRQLADLRNRPACLNSSPPLIVVLDSRQVTWQEEPALRFVQSSPFRNIGIPAGELLYYCRNTLVSGDRDKVQWSLLLRDLVAYRTEDHGGQAARSSDPNWCRELNPVHTGCPGLAVEVQVRSPLPVAPAFQSAAYLINPSTGQKTPQVPPVPAEMI